MSGREEERFIACHLAELTDGFSGALGLTDDCAELVPLPGHALVFKTDPIVEGVHFFSEDAPEDIGWKALAVNVSDLAAKGARPVAYLMALSLPEQPEAAWMARFALGLRAAQNAFGCVLIGGDTDLTPGPLGIAITIIGEVRAGYMVERRGATAGDLIYISGELGGAALGLKLRLDPDCASRWQLSASDQGVALQRYLRPEPKLGAGAALRAHARSSMDISDGLIKDLDRMCRLTGVGADVSLAALPLSAGVRHVLGLDQRAAIDLATVGDDYEILATVCPGAATEFEALARRGGVIMSPIGQIVSASGVRLLDQVGAAVELGSTGYDHFEINQRP